MSTSVTPLFPRRSTPDPIEIHLVQGSDEHGERAYYYVAVYRSMAKKLFISLKCKTTDLEQYGVIIASGFSEPDEDTKAYIRSLLLKNAS